MNKIILFSMFLILLSNFSFGKDLKNATQMKGVYVTAWNTGYFTEVQVDNTISACRKLGATDLFIQVRKFDDAYYSSNFVPQNSSIENFDPLLYTIKKAKEQGIKVHAWFVICRLSNGNYKSTLPINMQSWLNKDVNDNVVSSDNVYIDPTNTEARNYICKVIKEVVDNYDVDGVHLDYIRYPDKNFGFTDNAKLSFKKETGSSNFSSTAFADFRRKQLDNMVKEINLTVRNSKNGENIIISAATIVWGGVTPYIKSSSYDRVYQDWKKWLSNDWIDIAIPMLYKRESVSEQSKDFRKWVSEFRNISDFNRIAPAVSYEMNNAAQCAAQVRALEREGYGWGIFSFNEIKNRDALASALKTKI